MNTAVLQAKAEYYSNIDTAIAAATADKRAANCRGFLRGADGKVIGINLVHVPIPSARYELALAEMIPEALNPPSIVTVAVLNAEGFQTAETCWYAWPFPALDSPESPKGSGNSKNEFWGGDKFPSDVIGPLAYYVGDINGNPISDIVGGYGLPDGAHIGGRVTFRERAGVVVDPDPDPDPNPEPSTDSMGRIATAFERLVSHWGA